MLLSPLIFQKLRQDEFSQKQEKSSSAENRLVAGLPDFSWHNIPKNENRTK
jgi:hypothetical protein